MTLQVIQTQDIATCHAIRRAVFVEEQGVALSEEIDGKDDACIHFLLLQEDRPVATLRIAHSGETAKVQRVAVLREQRGKGYGHTLMQAAMDQCTKNGTTSFTLGAQLSAIPFYQSLGFTAHGPVFLDANIEHRLMTKNI